MSEHRASGLPHSVPEDANSSRWYYPDWYWT